MPKKPLNKGDTATLRAEIYRDWGDGRITLHIRGYEHPITLNEKYLDDVQPKPVKPKTPKPEKEPRQGNEAVWDDPKRGK